MLSAGQTRKKESAQNPKILSYKEYSQNICDVLIVIGEEFYSDHFSVKLQLFIKDKNHTKLSGINSIFYSQNDACLVYG